MAAALVHRKRVTLLAVLTAVALAAPAARAETYELLHTVGKTFDVNRFGGDETALASQVYRVVGGLLGTSTTYQVRYVVTSALLDFFDVTYTWGPLGAGVSLKGTLSGTNLSPETNISWVRATSSPPFPVRSAPAKLTPVCVAFCGGAGGIGSITADVDYHEVPGGVVTPPSPGAPSFAPLSARSLVIPLEGVPLRLDNQFHLTTDGGAGVDQTPARFISEVALRSDGQYRYGYEVRNDSESPLPYEWIAAGLSGTLDPHTSATRSFVASVAPMEGTAGAMFLDALGNEYAGPSGIFLPVPEPTSATVMLAGLAMLLWRLGGRAVRSAPSSARVRPAETARSRP